MCEFRRGNFTWADCHRWWKKSLMNIWRVLRSTEFANLDLDILQGGAVVVLRRWLQWRYLPVAKHRGIDDFSATLFQMCFFVVAKIQNILNTVSSYNWDISLLKSATSLLSHFLELCKSDLVWENSGNVWGTSAGICFLLWDIATLQCIFQWMCKRVEKERNVFEMRLRYYCDNIMQSCRSRHTLRSKVFPCKDLFDTAESGPPKVPK